MHASATCARSSAPPPPPFQEEAVAGSQRQAALAFSPSPKFNLLGSLNDMARAMGGQWEGIAIQSRCEARSFGKVPGRQGINTQLTKVIHSFISEAWSLQMLGAA